MDNTEVRNVCLEILRTVLAYEGEFNENQTFGELNVDGADLLDLGFQLQKRFGQDLLTQHDVDELKKRFADYDRITVREFLSNVCDRVQNQLLAA